MSKIINSIKSVTTSLVSAFLGAFAGAEGTSKNWRRFLIPFALAGLAYGHLSNFWVITIMVMMGAFSMGYGIPDFSDDGSALGRFWYNLFSFTDITRRTLLANVFTRGTIALMVNLSLISIPLIKGNWIIYGIGCLFIKLAYTTCSYRDLNGVWIKNKYLLWSDLIVYGTIGLVTSILIYF